MDLFDRLVGGHLARGRCCQVAYVDSELGQVTYDELGHAARRYAAGLAGYDLRPGTRALVIGDDSVATVVAILGLWLIQAVPVPVSPLLTDSELAFIAADCSAGFVHIDGPAARQPGLKALFPAMPRRTGDGTRDLIRSREPLDEATASDWPAEGEVLVQYTSGSTGTPKGVLHGLAGIEAVLAGFGRLLALTPDDTVLSTAKLSFGYGFGNSLLFPLAAGAKTVLMRGPVDAHRLAATIAETRPTVLCSVPRMYNALLSLRDKPDLGSLRLGVSAGEHLPAELRRRFEEAHGVPLVNGLGATEVLHIVLSDGLPVPGVVATIRDQHGAEVRDGGEGRLHIAGPTVALGYLARPEQTARTFAEGGAYTSDVVGRGHDGDIRYVCRADDLLNLGGYKVSPFEIESVVRGTPGVADCAVVGRTDEAGLQQAVAYVVATAGADRDEVRRAVLRSFRGQLAAFKRPHVIEVIDALPTTSTGKLARFQLRASAAVPPAPRVTTTVHNDQSARNAGERTIVCVPFAGGTDHAFARLTRRLPADWRVVTGVSTRPAEATLGAVADAWWDAVHEYLSPGSVLFGHSVGAAVVAEIGHRYADRLAGVHVVVSAPPLRLGDRLLAAVLDGDEEELLDALADSGLLPDRELSRDETARLVLPGFVADLQVLRGGWKAEPPGVPVHVLVGSADPSCPPEDVPAALEGWPVSAVHVVEGGHYFCVDSPDRTADILAEVARS